MRTLSEVVRIDNNYIIYNILYNIYTEECIELSSVGLAPARPNYSSVIIQNIQATRVH